MLTRWNGMGMDAWDRHFSALSDLRREMDRLFWDMERSPELGPPRMAGARATGWPPIHLQDTGGEFVLRAELPGISDKDLDITIERDTLTLRGKRETAAPEGYSVHRQERPSMQFARSFSLPSPIDSERVTANLSQGLLELTLPKAAEAQPRQIRVRAS